MASEELYRASVTTRTVEGGAAGVSYVDWGAILAGTVLTVTLSLVLITFGSAVGLSASSFQPGEGVSLFWFAVASGIWFVWVAVTSFGAGGYLAGRLRRRVGGASVDEIEVRDGAHGLMVWATAALVAAVLGASGITGVISSAGKAAGTVAQTAADAVGGDVSYIGSRLMQGDGDQATAVLKRTLADGQLGPEDREYLVNMVAQKTGQSPEQVQAQVDRAVAEAQELYQKAVTAAETARKAAAIAAFVAAATLMVSAAAAYLAAMAGGDHRDRNLPFGTFK
ncbi:hypothetical protein HNP73_000524 [Amaricoccus macauensis]|uniref:PhnA-like protein n=1 Tax=Amaricoccus macauensis TaxID=57001 RepID=A0A840SMD2_9RHOB|nr:hypothetical protein [Amaricoccus macauensis]MBB5220603.1 hypothetical protein [Amaricoccus macauensis]